MAHFKNQNIDQLNQEKQQQKGGVLMFGSEEQKPSNQMSDKFDGLGPGAHAVILKDMNSGVSDKSGKQYWIIELQTPDEKHKFNHFMPCEADEYKTEEQVFKKVAGQMEALGLYETIGAHAKLEDYIQKAINTSYELCGKTIEFTIKKWKMDDREGLWGAITGFLDTPNEAIQKGLVKKEPIVDESEELPF